MKRYSTWCSLKHGRKLGMEAGKRASTGGAAPHRCRGTKPALAGGACPPRPALLSIAAPLTRARPLRARPPRPAPQVQERQNRVCTTVAIAIVAETCAPFTVLPALMNEYKVGGCLGVGARGLGWGDAEGARAGRWCPDRPPRRSAGRPVRPRDSSPASPRLPRQVPELNVQNGVLKALSFLFEYIGEMGKDYIYAGGRLGLPGLSWGCRGTTACRQAPCAARAGTRRVRGGARPRLLPHRSAGCRSAAAPPCWRARSLMDRGPLVRPSPAAPGSSSPPAALVAPGAVAPLLEDALMDRDLVHRQTACSVVQHMSLGVAGLGCEDALLHLLNHVFPNIFEQAPHIIQVRRAGSRNRLLLAAFGNKQAGVLVHPLLRAWHPAQLAELPPPTAPPAPLPARAVVHGRH